MKRISIRSQYSRVAGRDYRKFWNCILPVFLYYISSNIIQYYPTRGNTIGCFTGSSAGVSELGDSAGSEFWTWASGSAGTGTILDSGAAGTTGSGGTTGDCGIIAGLGARGNSLSTSIT